MYIQKSNNGYSWYSKVKSKDMGGNELEGYLTFFFKKGYEPQPQELNDRHAYEGELYFRDSTGKERKVFPRVNEYNGNKTIQFMLLEAISEEVNHGGLGTQYQTTLNGEEDEEYYRAKETFDRNESEDLHFY